MSENKIFIAAGGGLINNTNSWPYICKEKLNYDLYDLTEEKIGNALISRKVISKVNELLKTNKSDDIIVGIMWTIPDIHERYISNGKNDSYVEKPEINLTSVVGNIKNWRVLRHEWISSSEDCNLYYRVIYNKLQSYILTLEHIMRTQWFLKKLGIKYFMTFHLDIFHKDENYLKMYNFEKLKDIKKRDHSLNILNYNEVHYLYNTIQKNMFLPIDGMLEWVQTNYSVGGFEDNEKLIPNGFGHEKFTNEMIIPFLKHTYNI